MSCDEDGAEPKQSKELTPDEGLWEAAYQGDLNMVKYYREKGGSVTFTHKWKPPGRAHQFTALHAAAGAGQAGNCFGTVGRPSPWWPWTSRGCPQLESRWSQSGLTYVPSAAA